MISSVIEAVYDDYAKSEFSNYDQRREDLNTLANFARQYQNAGEFLDQLALLTSLDSEVSAADEDTEMLTLSSVHQAKGLEWRAVFVIWMNEGMVPSSRSLESEEAIEEENESVADREDEAKRVVHNDGSGEETVDDGDASTRQLIDIHATTLVYVGIIQVEAVESALIKSR
jgi:superfamily I DNA/RNA helicase